MTNEPDTFSGWRALPLQEDALAGKSYTLQLSIRKTALQSLNKVPILVRQPSLSRTNPLTTCSGGLP